MLIAGLLLFYRGCTKAREAIPLGTFFTLLGLLLLLADQGLIHVHWWQTWTLAVLFWGIGFIALFLFDPDRKKILLSGMLLILLAFMLLLWPQSWDEFIFWVSKGWPLALALLGIWIIWKNIAKTGSSSRKD